MKIAIIGIGRVGSIVGKRWAALGHDVVFGARDPSSDKAQSIVNDAGHNARAASVSEAAESADIVVLATHFETTKEAIDAMGGLKGQIVMDCVNPLNATYDNLTVGTDTSAAEHIAAMAPEARIAKGLNMTGWPNMENPIYPEGAATMLTCGDDAKAKEIVNALCAELGFDAVDAGPLTAARLLEPLAQLWIQLSIHQGMGPDVAFRLMRR